MNFSEAIAQLGLSDKIDKKYKVEAVATTHHTSSRSNQEQSQAQSQLQVQ